MDLMNTKWQFYLHDIEMTKTFYLMYYNINKWPGSLGQSDAPSDWY